LRGAQSVVNDRQGAVVLFAKGKVEGVLVPPSLIYENRRKLPSARYSEPVFHVSAKEFQDSYHYNKNLNICADFLNSSASVVIVDKGGAPVLGMVPMQEAALLGFNEKGQVRYNDGGGPRLFTFDDPYEDGAWGKMKLYAQCRPSVKSLIMFLMSLMVLNRAVTIYTKLFVMCGLISIKARLLIHERNLINQPSGGVLYVLHLK
jgi:hypothetical protein